MLGAFDFDVIARSWRYLLFDGMALTLTLTVQAMAGGLVLGTALALMRLSPFKWLAGVAGAYVNLLRAIPLVMVIFWFYFMIPLFTGQAIGAEKSAFITFTIFEAAYYCEIIRAGIQATPKGQFEAGASLAMTRFETFQHVVLVPSLQRIWPALSSQVVIVMLGSSVVSQIAAEDLTFAANFIQSRTFRAFEAYMVSTTIYLLLAILLRQALVMVGGFIFPRGGTR